MGIFRRSSCCSVGSRGRIGIRRFERSRAVRVVLAGLLPISFELTLGWRGFRRSKGRPLVMEPVEPCVP